MRKRAGLVITSIIVSTLFSGYVLYAHTPSDIECYKNPEAEKLIVIVQHHTRKPYLLYIKKVEVLIDDHDPIIFTFSIQKRKRFPEIEVDMSGLQEAEHILIRAYPLRGKTVEKEFFLRDIPDYKVYNQERKKQ